MLALQLGGVVHLAVDDDGATPTGGGKGLVTGGKAPSAWDSTVWRHDGKALVGEEGAFAYALDRAPVGPARHSTIHACILCIQHPSASATVSCNPTRAPSMLDPPSQTSHPLS